MKTIVIAGGSGLLGINASKYLKKYFHVYSTYNNNGSYPSINNLNINLLDYDKLLQTIKKIKPDYIFNFAGLTNVEFCEKNQKISELLNIEISKNLSVVSQSLKIKFIHMSTDHLFHDALIVHNEEDETNPINVYAKTKFKAEKIVQKKCPNSLIIRSNFFCSSIKTKRSFLDNIINSVSINKEMLLFDDVYFTPVSFNYLLESIKLLLENNISGIFNISSTERITKYDFGIIVCDYLNLNKKLLTKISINDLDLVQRPLNMSLSNLKLSNSLQVVIPNLHKQLNIYFDKYSYKN